MFEDVMKGTSTEFFKWIFKKLLAKPQEKNSEETS